jgi:hypothetical protein
MIGLLRVSRYVLLVVVLAGAAPAAQERKRGIGWNCASGRCSSSQSTWANWHLSGSASISARGVTLTPDQPSVQGALWALEPADLLATPYSSIGTSSDGWVGRSSNSEAESFDLQLRYRVSGAGEVGADGFALWYTERGLEERFDPSMAAEFGAKHAFGHVDKWTGLGLFFDSYDNEDLEAGALGLGNVKHPRVLSIVNDGSFYWDHDAEGILEKRRSGGGLAASSLRIVDTGEERRAGMEGAGNNHREEKDGRKLQEMDEISRNGDVPAGGDEDGDDGGDEGGSSDDDGSSDGDSDGDDDAKRWRQREARARNRRRSRDAQETLRKIAEEKRQGRANRRQPDKKRSDQVRSTRGGIDDEGDDRKDGAHDSISAKGTGGRKGRPNRRDKRANRNKRGGKQRRSLLGRRIATHRRRHNSRRRRTEARRRAEEAAQKQRAAALRNLGRLDACHAGFRYRIEASEVGEIENTLAYDSWVRVTYQEKILSVYIGRPTSDNPAEYFDDSEGRDGPGAAPPRVDAIDGPVEWASCVSMKNVELPRRGYFGFSASTGDLHDAHQLVAFDVRSFSGFHGDQKKNSALIDSANGNSNRDVGSDIARYSETAASDYKSEYSPHSDSVNRGFPGLSQRAAQSRKEQRLEEKKQQKQGKREAAKRWRDMRSDGEEGRTGDKANSMARRTLFSFIVSVGIYFVLLCGLGTGGVLAYDALNRRRHAPLLPLTGASGPWSQRQKRS